MSPKEQLKSSTSRCKRTLFLYLIPEPKETREDTKGPLMLRKAPRWRSRMEALGMVLKTSLETTRHPKDTREDTKEPLMLRKASRWGSLMEALGTVLETTLET